MQNQNQNTNVVFPNSNSDEESASVNFAQNLQGNQALSLDPQNQPIDAAYVQADQPQPKKMSIFVRLAKRADVVLAALLILGSLGLVLNSFLNKESATDNNAAARFETTQLPLEDFVNSEGIDFGNQSVIINGNLRANDGLIIAPSLQPTTAVAGQMYYDQSSNVLSYYNGSQFVPVGSGVQSVGGLTGQIAIGGGLTVTGGQIANTGVLSVQGVSGNVVLAAGNGINISGTTITNDGVVSIVSNTPSLTVTDDGNGNITLGGSGSGTVNSPGGTVGRIPVFSGSQTIEDSIISQSGITATVTGDLAVVTGGLTLSNALTVSNGGTGTNSLALNGVLLGNGTGPVTAATAAGPNLCLISTAGAPIFTTCPSASGVTTLNGQTGAVNVANASGASGVITIDNATTSSKGIAQFNSTNFTVGSGVVNTVQNIDPTATPTFAGLNTNNITPSGALTVGSTTQQLVLQGNANTQISATDGGFTTTVNFNGTATGNVVYQFDRSATAGTYAICTTVGNCSGAAGITGSGTVGTIPLFTDTEEIGDSIVTQGSGVINIAGSLTLGAALGIGYGGTGVNTTPTNGQLLIGNGTGYTVANLTNAGGINVANGAGSIGLSIIYGSGANTAVQGNTALTCPSGTGNLTGGGTSITLGTGGTCAALNTVNNPIFTTSVTTPLVQNAGLTLEATGANSLQLRTNSTTRLTVTSGGDLVASGDMTLQGGTLTVGTTSQAGTLTVHDGAGATGVIDIATLSGNQTYTLPDASGEICLTSGNCAGAGGGIVGSGTTNSIAKFTGAGTIGDSSISDDGVNVTTTGDMVIQGGGLTVGTTGQSGLLVLHDGSGQTTTLQAGNSAGNLTFILPTTAGAATQCLKQSGTGNQLIWDDCEGGTGGVTGVTSLNSLSGALTIQGTANRITVNDNGSNTITLSTPQDIATSSSPTFVGLTLTGDVAVNGGDITSTGALNVTPGGTLTVGVTGQTLTLQGDASTSLTATAGANTTSLVFETPTGDNTITFPDASGEVCLTSGNCAGSGGGVTTAGGTAGTVAMFTGAQAIGDSIITQGSGVINIAGSLTLGSPLAIAYGGTGLGTTPTNGQLLIGNGTGYQLGTLTNNGGLTVTNGAGSIGLAVNYGATANTAVQGNTGLTCPSGTGNLTGGGTVITLGTGGTCAALNTVNNPIFTTSVTTPLVQNAGLIISSTGGNSLQLQTNGNTRLTIASGGDLTATGDMTLQGGSLTVGADNQVGGVSLYDGGTGVAAHTGTLQVISSLGQNTTYVLPDPGTGTVSICLTTGNCAGSGGGITGAGTTNQLSKFTGTGTIGDSSISDDGTTVVTTADMSIQGGALTVGTSSQVGTVILNDGNGGQTTTLQAGNSAGNLTFIMPTNAGTAAQCLKQSGTGNQLIWDDCEGGSGGISGVTSLNSLAGALTIQGTSGQVVVGDNGTDTLTLSLASAVTLQGNTFNGASQLVQLNASTQLPAVSGALLTDLNGSAITSGTINNARLTGSGALTVTAGTGLTGGGSVALGGATTLNVSYGSAAGTAVQGNTQLTVTAGTNLTGGGTVTLGSGGTLTVNVASSPTFAGNVIIQGGSLTVGTASQAGSLVVHDGTGFTGTVSTDTLTDDRTYSLPDASGEICLTTGNCAGAGPGVTTAGGTTGTIAVFTGTQAIGDSLLSQAAGTVTANGHLNLTTGNQYRINGVQISSANLSNDANLAKLNTSQTFTGNNNTFRNGANSANGFSVQRSDGVGLLTADTTGGQIALGTASSLDGKLLFNSAGSANTVSLLADSLTGSRTILLPDANGTICLDSGNCAGAGATLQTAYNFSAGGTTPKIKVNSSLGGVDIQDADTTIGANLLSVRASNGSGLGSVMFGVDSTGSVVLQNSANSTDALRLLTAGGTTVLTGDTQNGRVMLGQANTLTGSLLFNHSASAFLGTLVQGALTGNRTYTLPDVSGTICLTIGNCAGSAGGVTTAGGTTNRLSVFTGAQTLGDAWLNQNTTTLELDATRNLSLLGGNLSVTGGGTFSGDIAVNGGDITSTGALNVTPGGALTVGVTTQTALLQGSVTTITSTGAGNDIVLNSADIIDLQDNTTVTGNLQIQDAATPTKSYRLRTSGGDLDFESGGAKMYLSNWTNADYTGTQRTYLVFENTTNMVQAIGGWHFRTAADGTTRHTIDGSTGTHVTFNQTGEATNFSVQGDSDTSLLFIQGTTDRVGIGTNTPGFKLDVNGTLGVTGNTTLTGDLAVNGGDITSSGALNITPGGVLTAGATGQQFILQGNVSSTITATGDGFTTTVGFNGTATANVRYDFDRTVAAGTYEICTSANNCVGTASSLQDAYDVGNTITTTDGRNVAITLADTATDSNFLINLQCDTTCSTNGRFAIQDDGTDVFTISPAGGSANFINFANSTQAFNVENSTGGNLLTVDTTNSRVGINLGADNTPNMNNTGLQVGGSIRMSGSSFHTFTTPNNSSVNADFSIDTHQVTSGSQLIALGLSDTSDDNATGISVFDDRSSANKWPTISVWSPDEANLLGLTWANSTSEGRLTTHNKSSATAAIAIQSGNTSGDTTTGTVAVRSGDGTGTNSSSGAVNIDSGAKTGAGTAGAVNIGTTNTGAITLGNATNNSSITLNSGTGTIALGTGAQARTINMGTGAAVQTINLGGSSANVIAIGNTQTGGSVSIGTAMTTGSVSLGGNVLNLGSNNIARTVNVGTGAAQQIVTVGSTNSTSITTIQGGAGGVNLGTGGVANTVQIGNTTGAVTQTVNLGNNATASSVTNVTIGSLIGTSTTTIQGGTNDINLTTNASTASIIAKSSTNNNEAFKVVNSSNVSLLTVKTNGTLGTDMGTYVLGTGSNGAGGRLFFGSDLADGVYIGEEGTTNTDRMLLFGDSGFNFEAGAPGVSVLDISVNGLATFKAGDSNFGGVQFLEDDGTQIFFADTAANTIQIGNYFPDSTAFTFILDSASGSDPAVTINGAMYFNTDMGQMRCYYDSKWRYCNEPLSLSYGYNISDDFVANFNTTEIGQLGWSPDVNNTGGITGASNIANRNGIMQLFTGTGSSTPNAAIYLNASGDELAPLTGGEEIEFAVNIPTLADGTNDFNVRMGLCDVSSGADCDDGIYIEYDRDTSVNWRYATANTGARTKTNSSVAVTTGWHRFKFVVNSNATSVQFFMDGSSLGTISTNIPTATSQPEFVITKDSGSGTADRTLEVDYFQMRKSLTTPR